MMYVPTTLISHNFLRDSMLIYDNTHSDLDQKISQMFLEIWNILIKTEQPLYENFDLWPVKEDKSKHQLFVQVKTVAY